MKESEKESGREGWVKGRGVNERDGRILLSCESPVRLMSLHRYHLSEQVARDQPVR